MNLCSFRIAHHFFAAGALLSLILSSGCANTGMSPRMDAKRVARQIGFPDCQVSIPLSQDELVSYARLSGIEDPTSSDDWVKMKATYLATDDIRLVSCGYSFFGLFRDNKLVMEMYEQVDN